MSVNTEYCNPFSADRQDIWMKLEHCGRYLYACDRLTSWGCGTVTDLAASNGYGSRMLRDHGFSVCAADRNPEYLASEYLQGSGISCFCFDFDLVRLCDRLPRTDAVVCFETIEHLRDPFGFLAQLPELLKPAGRLLLSFPNARYERLEPDGTNKDPFHLHILDRKQVTDALKAAGFVTEAVLGQPLCNELCTRQHDLSEAGLLQRELVDRAFHYDSASVITLARLMGWPQAERLENSYSFLVEARLP